MDIGGWLRSVGLERYEAAFRENASFLCVGTGVLYHPSRAGPTGLSWPQSILVIASLTICISVFASER